MNSLTQDIYTYEYRHRERLADLEKHRQVMQTLGSESHSRFLPGLNGFVKMIKHLRHIQIDVTFNYQDAEPKTASSR